MRGDASWVQQIIVNLAAALGKKLPYATLPQVRARLAKENAAFARVDEITPAKWTTFGTAGKCGNAPFAAAIENFYMTDPISRASKTMQACTDAFVKAEDDKKAVANA